ncbi:MAG: DUF2284 domain-containing protein [Desulfarculus sp.]|nr:MAG: DUF2284 domain-containing protein [Desulfarculus sp.]
MEVDCEALAAAAREAGAGQARLMDAAGLVFDPRAALKCRFGCPRYGRAWTCPPHLGLSPEQIERALAGYQRALVIVSPEAASGQRAALAVEKAAMAQGLSFALALALCVHCDPCVYPDPCPHPKLARPSLAALGLDVAATVKPLGLEVRLDPEGKLLPAWYTLVLLD